MKVLSFSETGSVRRHNEDRYLTLPDYGLYAVADGMGGELAGEIAAELALRQLESLAPALPELAPDEGEDWLLQAIKAANRVVFESAQHPERQGMGTTLTTLLVRGHTAVVAHVGDSRAYLWRSGELIPLTQDHSLPGELVRLGQISPEEAEHHPQRHVLIRAVGTAAEVEVDCRRLEILPADTFLLCTDGVSNAVSEAELGEELARPVSWEERIERLRQLIWERGAKDNFTALCWIGE